jgi:hypothetical protein
MTLHNIGLYQPAAILLDRGTIQPEAVAYGSAAHPERGGMGLKVPLFAAARDTQTVVVHESIHASRTVRQA